MASYQETHFDYRLELDKNAAIQFEFPDLIMSLHDNQRKVTNNIREVFVSSRYLETLSTVDQAKNLLEIIGKLPKLFAFELNFHHLHQIHHDAAIAIQQSVCDNILLRNEIAYSKLSSLKLWNIQIDDNDQISSLARAVQNLTALDDFCINIQQQQGDHGEIVDICIDPLLSVLSKLPSLKKVFIGMGCSPRHRQQQQMTTNDGNITNLGSANSPLGALCMSPSLKALGLDQVRLTTSDIATISEALKNESSQMRVLSLWNTGDLLSESSVDEISQMLRLNRSLHWLTLKNVGLDDDGCTAIASALEDNTVLEELIISQNNRIGQKGYKALIKMLKSNKNDMLKSIISDAKGDIRVEMDLYAKLDRRILRNLDTATIDEWIDALACQRKDLNGIWYLLSANPSIIH